MKRIRSSKSWYQNKNYKIHSKKSENLRMRISQNARRIKPNKTERKKRRRLLTRNEARASYQILSSNPSKKREKAHYYDSATELIKKGSFYGNI